METTNEIETWLLILTLFLPRLGLFLAWCTDQIPANTMPFIGDLILAIIFPRLLMIIYIVGIYGFGGWFWVHLIAWIIALGMTHARYKNSSRKT